MYLDRILGSKIKINTISALISNQERSFMESELAKEIDASLSEVSRQIKDLVYVGLVTMERVGKAKVYRINKEHFLSQPLKNLFRELIDVYREIANEISSYIVKKHKPQAIILFGSLAKGKIRSDFIKEPSDIDILLVVEKKHLEKIKADVINFISSKIIPKYGVSVYPVVISVEDYKENLDKDQFIMAVHSEGEVLYGEKPRKFS